MPYYLFTVLFQRFMFQLVAGNDHHVIKNSQVLYYSYGCMGPISAQLSAKVVQCVHVCGVYVLYRALVRIMDYVVLTPVTNAYST